nr:YidB family protein [Phenylobacterium sp. SCN 70-31]
MRGGRSVPSGTAPNIRNSSMSGILGNILGGVLGGGKGASAGPADILGDLLGGAGGGQDGGGLAGGLGGLIKSFDDNGLGDIARSWIAKGDNLPISAEQIEAVLGSGPLANIAGKLGIDPAHAAATVSQILPQIIDQLTPDGEASGGGLAGALSGGLGDILGKLGR